MSTLESLGLARLSFEEKLSLVQDLWDSLAADAAARPLNDALKAEIDRRLAAHEADPDAAIPWEQVEAEALARYGDGA